MRKERLNAGFRDFSCFVMRIGDTAIVTYRAPRNGRYPWSGPYVPISSQEPSSRIPRTRRKIGFTSKPIWISGFDLDGSPSVVRASWSPGTRGLCSLVIPLRVIRRNHPADCQG